MLSDMSYFVRVIEWNVSLCILQYESKSGSYPMCRYWWREVLDTFTLEGSQALLQTRISVFFCLDTVGIWLNEWNLQF